VVWAFGKKFVFVKVEPLSRLCVTKLLIMGKQAKKQGKKKAAAVNVEEKRKENNGLMRRYLMI